MTLTHVASRFVNCPLMIHPPKLEVIIKALGPRLGIDPDAVLARRAQVFGFALGLVGVVGSLFVVVKGFPVAGTTIATGCVLSLVTVFVLGRESQKRERLRKEEVRQKMGRGDPIEELERPSPPDRSAPMPDQPGDRG